MGKVLIVGASGTGRTHLVASILAEVGMTMQEPFILNDEVINGKTLVEMMTNAKPPTFEEPTMILRNVYKDLDKHATYVPTKKKVESYHPFKKFMGKKIMGKGKGNRRRW